MIPNWLITLLIAIPIYELIRYFILGRLSKTLQEQALAYVRKHRVTLEAGRFTDRIWIRQALLNDTRIDAAVAVAAKERQTPIRELEAKVEAWIHEMTPSFSLAAYYRGGAVIARFAVNFAYELVFDPNSYKQAMSKVPEGAVVVFVINHRSNADYVVLSYGLLQHMALSYAVGEWARVWPLDALFRSFGSFFLRRGEKDRLYHVVLERFVQLLVTHGGTMGFFIEGGLSRDGKLRAPKAGLLDYIIGIRREHPERELVFIPIGLNFDRVLEDRMLLKEADQKAPGVMEKLSSLLSLLSEIPSLLLAQFWRIATRSHRKLGYAAVHVGEPLKFSDWPQSEQLAGLPDEERRAEVKKLAGAILGRIARVIPATPVPLVCAGLLRGPALREELLGRVREMLVALRKIQQPVALGRGFSREEGESGIEGLEDAIEASAEAGWIVDKALILLKRRKLVVLEGNHWQIVAGEETVARYYAASLPEGCL